MFVLIAVKLEFCGKGISCYLIDGAIKQTKEQDYIQVKLDVLAINPSLGFYPAVGLELLAETRATTSAKFGVPPGYCMGRSL